MKGSIIESNQIYYTNLKEIFNAIGNIQKKYNWLITNYECYPTKSDTKKILSDECCFVSGEKITEIVENEDLQWIWGVFSGFDKSIPMEEVIEYEKPYAEDNSGFWRNPISIQHPLAEIEIIAWDSSKSLIISKNDEVIKSFNNYFSYAIDLEEYNKKL